jgi:DNA-binding transcriptional regulator YhcF (GntR family)
MRIKIHIDKRSEVPVHHQLREQIIFLMGTGKLSMGDTLPSVRELARQLQVHHNTVSHVYADLVRGGWLVNRRGSRVVVVRRGKEKTEDPGEPENLDDLINRTIRLARERGFSLQQVGARIRERLLEQPPDHLLVVEPEKELGELIREEIRQVIGHTPATCSISALQQNPNLAIGALLLAPSYLVDGLDCIPSKDRNFVPITYSPVDELLARVRNLSDPLVIGVLSVSPGFLTTASGLLAPVIGGRHSLHTFIMKRRPGRGGAGRPYFTQYAVDERPIGPGARSWAARDGALVHKTRDGVRGNDQNEGFTGFPQLASEDLRAIDLLFCDSITYHRIKHPRRVMYQLLSDESLREVASLAKT